MSHIVTIQARLRDPALLAEVCRRLGLPEPVRGTMTAADGQTAEGLLIPLPGWRVPIAVAADGTVRTERWNGVRLPIAQEDLGRPARIAGGGWNFGGYEPYGQESELNKLLQAYAVEAAKLAARRAGRNVLEQRMADGSVRLTIEEA